MSIIVYIARVTEHTEVSMGGRATLARSLLPGVWGAKVFASADSKKTLRCL